ncbi:MAG TPA: condensation domain-containing protein [Candidatus Acidoferrales bacterium]|nr:condensation domain-containing protein [Candidatus Acidoferrales bacterium]
MGTTADLRLLLEREPHEQARLGPVVYRFPCTPAQQALWFLDRLEPGNPAWNIAVRFRITGALERSLLERAINGVVERHEILRTTFAAAEGEPWQEVHDGAFVPLPLDDLSVLSPSEQGREEEGRTIAEARTPFELRRGPLLRARLLRLSSVEHILLFTVHHIVADGWSIGVFSEEISMLYADFFGGQPSSLAPLRLQYADYAVWLRELGDEPALEKHRDFWREKLKALPRCEVPPDFPRPGSRTHRSYILSELLPEALTNELGRVAAANDCTMNAACLAALKLLLSRYTGQSDICVGSLVAGRDRVELEPLIGLFINTVVLRTDLSGDPTFSELMSRVNETLQEALLHQDLHFQSVVETLRPERDPSRPVLYSVNFIYQRDFVMPREFAGLSMTPLPSKSPGAIYDLNFFMVRRSDGWRLSCEYNIDLYAPETVARLLAELRSLFRQIAADPDQRISCISLAGAMAQPVPQFVPRR